jgi:uncharacterized protein (TIGR03437 family)
MLRLTVSILITVLLPGMICLQRVDSSASLTRVTNTPEHALNLNPSLSDDGKVFVFESTADLTGSGQSPSFHAIRVEGTSFTELARARIVCPSLSADGKAIAFASSDDLVGRNPDRNSEIYLFAESKLTQLTVTQLLPGASRLSDGSFQPSTTADGEKIAFSSNQDLVGANGDLSFEIFLYNRADGEFTQLTNSTNEHVVVASPKISAEGSRVYYRRTALNGDSDLMLLETGTMISRVVAANMPDLSIAEGRAVSNDGTRLVYSALTGTNQSQVFMFDARDNSTRQLTQLGARATDVKLQATISGDGRRVAFATRRRVVNASDGGVELYVADLPSGEMQQITNAPSSATAEVVSSLNFDGSLVAFNFPRILSGPVSDDELRNNSEIYLAAIPPRAVGVASVVNGAAHGREPQPTLIAPGSIASIRGSSLAIKTLSAEIDGSELPFELDRTTVTVKGQPARIFYVSPTEVVFVVPGLASGPAEFLVTNREGLSSRAEAVIRDAAPGVFTAAGDGRGEAIILNSDTLTRGPFDPTNGQLRLSIFATGVSRAALVSAEIGGRTAIVEAVEPARLPGLDEIHVLVPAELRGAGGSSLVVTADGVRSNPVSVVLVGVAPTPTPTPSPSPTATPSPSPSPTATPSPSTTPTPSPSPTPSPGASPSIVISQIFGGGGNAGAPFRNDYIEIFNAGNVPVDLTGWSVQYASATASTWAVTPLTAVTLLPGRYYLVQESSGGSNGAALTAPDAAGTIAMAAGSGKVALVRHANALTGACPNDSAIVDFAGYGNTANCFRGAAPAAAPSNTTALRRAGSGCIDTRNNVADFSTGTPSPRNSNSPAAPCAQIVFARKGAKTQRKPFQPIYLCVLASLRGEFLRGG